LGPDHFPRRVREDHCVCVHEPALAPERLGRAFDFDHENLAGEPVSATGFHPAVGRVNNLIKRAVAAEIGRDLLDGIFGMPSPGDGTRLLGLDPIRECEGHQKDNHQSEGSAFVK
jgi:hypothetical protein